MHNLLCIHGEQIFLHGFFQADPHPGNFLLLADSGKLGLIDFGQAKALDVADRRRLSRLVIAVADDNGPEIVRVLRDEYHVKGGSYFLERVGRFAFGGFDARMVGGKSMEEVGKEMSAEEKEKPIFPGELYLPMRTSVLRAVHLTHQRVGGGSDFARLAAEKGLFRCLKSCPTSSSSRRCPN